MPNKRRLTAEAVVFDPAGRVLLVRQGREPGDWELPGGKVKKTESVLEAIVREVHEETGLAVAAERLIGIFFIREQNTYDFVFACRLKQRDARPRPAPPEIVECGFFEIAKPPQPIRPFTIQRVNDAAGGVSHPLPVELRPGHWLR
jgi:8-oxo-dGTP pyrophosphatase MutT (NUDIX family)